MVQASGTEEKNSIHLATFPQKTLRIFFSIPVFKVEH